MDLLKLQKGIFTSSLLVLILISGCTSSGTTFYVAKGGDDANPGTESSPFLTIQKGAEIAQPGDVIMVREGTYRERVMPGRGGNDENSRITYQAYPGEKVVITGLEPFTGEWVHEGGNIYSTQPEESMFTDTAYLDGGNPYIISHSRSFTIQDWDRSYSLSLGHLVVNGIMWKEQGKMSDMETTPESWWCDLSQGKIYANFPNGPLGYNVEITARRGVFRPYKVGLGYITVKGFVLEYCANQFPAGFWKDNVNAQSGLLGTRKGHHWIIENNVVRYAKSIGISIGQSSDNEIPAQSLPEVVDVGYHIIRNNLITMNGCVGVMGLGHHDVQVVSNKITKNNYMLNTAPEIAGVKFHAVYNAVIENNLFEDNDCHGLWLDNTWPGCRVSANLFINSAGQNIMMEMDDPGEGKEAILDNNVIIDCRLALHRPNKAENNYVGIYSHDASRYTMVNNLIMDMSQFAIYMRDNTARKGDCHHNRSFNNLLINNELQMNVPMITEHSYANESEHNVFATSDARFVVGTFADDRKSNKEVMPMIIDLWHEKGSTPPDLEEKAFPDSQIDGGYELNLNQWRAMMGFDLESKITKGIEAEFDRNTYTLTITVDNSLQEVGYKQVPGVDKDYFGQPISSNPLIGPFQKLTPGKHILKLWENSTIPIVDSEE